MEDGLRALVGCRVAVGQIKIDGGEQRAGVEIFAFVESVLHRKGAQRRIVAFDPRLRLQVGEHPLPFQLAVAVRQLFRVQQIGDGGGLDDVFLRQHDAAVAGDMVDGVDGGAVAVFVGHDQLSL